MAKKTKTGPPRRRPGAVAAPRRVATRPPAGTATRAATDALDHESTDDDAPGGARDTATRDTATAGGDEAATSQPSRSGVARPDSGAAAPDAVVATAPVDPSPAAIEGEPGGAGGGRPGAPRAAAPTGADVVPSGAARRVGRIASGTPTETRRPAARPETVKRGRPGRSPIIAAADLDPDDASIPLAAVPYATADLRRVGVIASAMVVLIIVAAIVVNLTVK